MTPNLITPEALAAKFGPGVSRRKVLDWTRQYGWPHVGVGRFIGYLPEHVDQIMASHTVATSTAGTLPRISGQTARSQRRAS